jgi:hypothetical protein
VAAADERNMAERPADGRHSKKSRPVPPDEQGSLSARMRELILGFNVEERRQRRQEAGEGDAGNDRRQSDHTNEKPAS